MTPTICRTTAPTNINGHARGTGTHRSRRPGPAPAGGRRRRHFNVSVGHTDYAPVGLSWVLGRAQRLLEDLVGARDLADLIEARQTPATHANWPVRRNQGEPYMTIVCPMDRAGWNHLLHGDLAVLLPVECPGVGPPWRAGQIKERFGKLKIHHGRHTPFYEGIGAILSDVSATTCIYCGRAGRMRRPGWMHPACDQRWTLEQRNPELMHRNREPIQDRVRACSRRALRGATSMPANCLVGHLAELGWKDLLLIDKGPLPNPGGSTGHASNFIFPNRPMRLHNGRSTTCSLTRTRCRRWSRSGGVKPWTAAPRQPGTARAAQALATDTRPRMDPDRRPNPPQRGKRAEHGARGDRGCNRTTASDAVVS